MAYEVVVISHHGELVPLKESSSHGVSILCT
jgi:hypothetical protein